MALGAFGQMIWLDTKRGVSIAQFSAQAVPPDPFEDTYAAMRAIVDSHPMTPCDISLSSLKKLNLAWTIGLAQCDF